MIWWIHKIHTSVTQLHTLNIIIIQNKLNLYIYIYMYIISLSFYHMFQSTKKNLKNSYHTVIYTTYP